MVTSLEACRQLCEDKPESCDVFHYASIELPAPKDREICYLWKTDNDAFKEPSNQPDNTLGVASGCYDATSFGFGK